MLEVRVLPGIDHGIPTAVGEEDQGTDPAMALISWHEKQNDGRCHASEECDDNEKHVQGDSRFSVDWFLLMTVTIDFIPVSSF